MIRPFPVRLSFSDGPALARIGEPDPDGLHPVARITPSGDVPIGKLSSRAIERLQTSEGT